MQSPRPSTILSDCDRDVKNEEKTKVSQLASKISVKRKLGRPPKDPSERRTERVDVFFSIAERLKLNADAKACGLSPASYVRKLVAGFRPTTQAEHAADPRLLLELNAIGNNVGQTMRAIKVGTQSKADWQQLKRDLEDALQMVALDKVFVSPKLLLQLHTAGALLNRAVADMHAGSQRKHNWRELRLTLHDLLMEVAASDVH